MNSFRYLSSASLLAVVLAAAVPAAAQNAPLTLPLTALPIFPMRRRAWVERLPGTPRAPIWKA